jgi:ATP-binding cassette subfamily F protein 3
LSGGEKARLQLARLLKMEANFLILDEPTNHLDIAAREVVEEALENYQGTLLIISHDRYFLDRIVDSLAIIDNQDIEQFDGNFTEWWQKKRIRERDERRAKSDIRAMEKEKGDVSTLDDKKLLDLEKEIDELEKEKQRLEFDMARNINERGKHHSVQNLKDLKQVTRKLELKYQRWEEIAG